MALSHWKDPDSRVAYERAYNASLSLWPLPVESRHVTTAYGDTHVLVSGAADGEPVVLIHAASLSAIQWYPQASDLGRTHRLFALDIMGDIGLSRQTAAIHSREDAAGWLVATLDALGIDRAIFVGSSFGGFQAANLAVHYPDRVRGLALLAPAATLRPFAFLANLFIRTGSLLPLPATVKPGLKGMMSGSLPDPRIVRQMELGVAGFRYDRAGIYPSALPDDELAGITCPTLVLLGDREMIYDPTAAAVRARAHIPGCSVAVIPGVGHLLGLQRPDIVNPRLSAFVASVERPARVAPEAVLATR
jgi:pimeloyl-ACP methyl ester carboxylesterase